LANELGPNYHNSSTSWFRNAYWKEDHAPWFSENIKLIAILGERSRKRQKKNEVRTEKEPILFSVSTWKGGERKVSDKVYRVSNLNQIQRKKDDIMVASQHPIGMTFHSHMF
jgi:hypothetical protein